MVKPAMVLLRWPSSDPAMTDAAFACAGSDKKQQADGDGITYTVEWQVLTMPSPAANFSQRPSACRPRTPSWQLSVPGREPQIMLIRGSSADPARSTIGSLGQLQRAYAQLGPNTVQSTRDANGLTTLQLTMCCAVANTPAEPSPVIRTSGRPQPAAHAALLGVGKVAALEMPAIACAALDLDSRAAYHPSGPSAGSGAAGDVHGIALHGGTCLAPRLLPAPSKAPAGGRGLPSAGLNSLDGASVQPGK